MNLVEKYKLVPIITVGIVCLIIGILGGLLTPTPLLKMIQLSFAIFFYLFVPGYFLLLTVNLDNIERIISSIGVSIAFVSIIILQIDFLGGLISFKNTIIVIISFVMVGILLNERQDIIKRIKKV